MTAPVLSSVGVRTHFVTFILLRANFCEKAELYKYIVFTNKYEYSVVFESRYDSTVDIRGLQ